MAACPKCNGSGILQCHRCKGTGKAPLILLPALVLHERGGDKHSPQAEAILRGEAALEWD